MFNIASLIMFSRNKEGDAMAKPIEETPFLREKKAEYFFARVMKGQVTAYPWRSRPVIPKHSVQ